jgi:hypothetical protein
MTTFTVEDMTVSNSPIWHIGQAEGKAKGTLGEPDASKGCAVVRTRELPLEVVGVQGK